MWSIVALSGVTCGGKSTITAKLNNVLKHSVIINQDTYFYLDDSPHHVKVNGMDHNNYDILSSLNMEKMYTDILKITSSSMSQNDDESSVLIIDGFTVLNYKPIADLCHLKYQVVLDRDECFRRRSLRVYSPPDIPGYFEQCVWPEFCKYNEEVKKMKDVKFIDGTAEDNFEMILDDIKKQFPTVNICK